MSRNSRIGLAACLALAVAAPAAWYYATRPQAAKPPAPDPPPPQTATSAPPAGADALEAAFAAEVRPFLARYCLGCHGPDQPEAALDLSRDTTAAGAGVNLRRWEQVHERLSAREMPPEDAPRRPTDAERAAVIAWARALHERETRRNAGDPGPVLARRLSNAELDYTIRDLTGADLRPTREFPIDPANEAGFDNSGESLTMSPALFRKYLEAAARVADHLVLKPDGLVFAPHPAVTDTDRDRYCVARIIDFYRRHQVDLADYFLAAWKYRWRDQTGQAGVGLDEFAADAGLSDTYLAVVWSALTGPGPEAGPLAAVRKRWNDLPSGAGADVRQGCVRLRDLVLRLRKPLRAKPPKVSAQGTSPGSQPIVLANNRRLARLHRRYTGDVFPDLRLLQKQLAGPDADLAALLHVKDPTAAAEKRCRIELERFCSAFPDTFVVTDRGPYFNPAAAGQGRPLTAGFHLMQGYFRDDEPLTTLILDDRGRRELDALWHELNFITRAPLRQYKDFIFFERAESRFIGEAAFDFARSEDKDVVSGAKIRRLADVYLAKVRRLRMHPDAVGAVETYFRDIAGEIRRVEDGRRASEPGHLEALAAFAARAYRRPLTAAERDDLLGYYRKLRDQEKLGHEEAVRAALLGVLLSPHFYYRFDLAPQDPGPRPLPPYALASRLSYFLWSSMPDAELLAHAASGDLLQPGVLKGQARRMLRDERARGLATEFAGNWLDFRRFEEHNAVDRARFPAFTAGLRQAMFEEPVRFFLDVAGRNRSVLDFLLADDTFVNRPLARHYGMPEPAGDAEWVHVRQAGRFGRGGLLPMAVFLTKNAPGLRTSPVKRGYWVVRRVLGEQIPPPPPTVPELPKDEAATGERTLPQLLARHRADKSCAGCHRRFDSVGLAFEGFGPVGERRARDLGGRPVQTAAAFPDGVRRDGLAGLRGYLRDKRQEDFLRNLSEKLFSYALGRGLLPSDGPELLRTRKKLADDGYAFASLVESIVASPQFRNRRGRATQPAESPPASERKSAGALSVRDRK
jgi:mono/diheme cytochrome c family protein